MEYINAILEPGFDFKTSAPLDAKNYTTYTDTDYLLSWFRHRSLVRIAKAAHHLQERI